MAGDVVLSTDDDGNGVLVTTDGRRIRDTQIDLATDTLDWAKAGVTGLRRHVNGQDASNSFTADIDGSWLRFTAQSTGNNQHEAWEISGTQATDSVMTSLLGYSSALAASNTQWGHIHRMVYNPTDQLFHAFAVWTDTTIPVPTLVNHGVCTWPAGGVGTLNINNAGQNGIPAALAVLRYLPIVRAQRTSNVVTLHTTMPWLPRVGDLGSLVTNTDTSFHISNAPVTAVDYSLGTLSYAQTAANATDATAGGTWQPATLTATIPFWLSSRLIGDTIQSKLWRPEEPEPDWSHPVRVTSFTISAGSPAAHSGAGACAFWVAHLETPNVMRFGGTRVTRLS